VPNSSEKTYSPFCRNNLEKISIEKENFQKKKLPVVRSAVKVKNSIMIEKRKGKMIMAPEQ
jgi:hypothetical protein